MILDNDNFGGTQVVVHPMEFAGESWQDKVVNTILAITTIVLVTTTTTTIITTIMTHHHHFHHQHHQHQMSRWDV